MRRILWWAFNLAAAVSMLMCVAVAGLWHRGASASHGDSLTVFLARSGPSPTIYGLSYAEQMATLGIDGDKGYVLQTGIPLGPNPVDGTPTLRSRFNYLDYDDEYIRPSWPYRHIHAANPNYHTIEHLGLKHVYWEKGST